MRYDDTSIPAVYDRSRPNWLLATESEVGNTIQFVLDEMGLKGSAQVVAIADCPSIRPGVGRPVLATVTHYNGNVYTVRLANGETIEPTGRHRLFSITRGGWTSTSSLEPGELLRTRRGDVAIESIDRQPGVHRVYNLEVETEHCYYVADSCILSHNTNPCAVSRPSRPPNCAEFEKLAFGHRPNRTRFRFPWSDGNWGTRYVDDYIPQTRTIQEATKLSWSSLDLSNPHTGAFHRFSDKLKQAELDGWLLRNDRRVDRVVWYGIEPLPRAGPAAQLTRALERNGITYRIVDVP